MKNQSIFKQIYLALIIVSILLACDKPVLTEQEETAQWNATILDSSYRLLNQHKDTTPALQYFDQQLNKMESVPLYLAAARYTLKANYFYFFSSRNDSTAAMIDSALAFYASPELQNRYPRAYVSMLLFGGHIAYRLYHYTKANNYYFRAKKMGDAHLDPCERAPFNYSIAMVLYRQQNYRESLNYFKTAYTLQNSCSPQTPGIILQQQEIQSNIGLCFTHLKEYDSALVHYDYALTIANANHDSLGAAVMDNIYGVIYGNQASVALARGQFDEAERLFKKSIVLNDRDGYDKGNATWVKLQLADVYLKKDELPSMYSMLEQVDSTVRKENVLMEQRWYQLLATYYEQTGQLKQGLDYLKRFEMLRDSTQREQAKLSEADVNRQLIEKEKELEIVILKREKYLAIVYLWVTIVFVGMALLIIFLVWNNYRRSRKNLAISEALNQEINHQKAAREEEERKRHKMITEAVIQAQEKERSIIGLELHDNINQVLTTVKLHNEMIMEGLGDPKELLTRASGYLQNCINEIRSLSRRLSAPTLGKIRLEDSVKDLVDSINCTSKVRITHEVTGFEDQVLKQDLHIGLYRILQEQLNNVLKHSEASNVSILLRQVDGMIRLSIIDDGKGFCMSKDKEGIGLMNMQTRAESLNGSFALTTRPGEGCRVEVVLPGAM
ncbi:MAG: tetratricopeptide repeat-containing sensor histidine kinase [Flavisolibacter sp.]